MIKKSCLLVSCGIAMWASFATADANFQSTLDSMFNDMRDGGQQNSLNVSIGHGVTLQGTVELTTKGNGGIAIANLDLRTYDTHDDGLVYKDKILNVDLEDLSGDGYMDIIVSGIAIHTLTKPYKEESVVFIYRYLPDKKVFAQVYRKASFEIDMNK